MPNLLQCTIQFRFELPNASKRIISSQLTHLQTRITITTMAMFVPFVFQEEDYHPFMNAPRLVSHRHQRRPAFTIAVQENPRLRPLRRKEPETPAFKEVVNVRGFDPKEVKVEVSEDKKKITVRAHAEHSEEGMTVTRNLDKSFDVPEDCDVEKLQKRMIPCGSLVLFAPKLQKAASNHDRQEAPGSCDSKTS